VDVNDLAAFRQAMAFDHVAASYRDNRRGNANFIASNCLMLDCDNDHSADPAAWVTPQDVQQAFPGVAFYVCYSRSHMKQKGDHVPRPKFHVYFPIAQVMEAGEYRQLKERARALFPAFDANATDAGRFFFGVEHPQVEYVEGAITLTDFFKQRPVIREGEGRNGHINKLAYDVQYNTRDSKKAIEAARAENNTVCLPPLDEREFRTTVKSAITGAERDIAANPDYVPPEQYNSFYVWQLPIADPNALSQLSAPDPKARVFSIAAGRLFLQAFGITLRINEMNKRAEINGLPPAYDGEDALNLLETLITDAVNTLAYKKAGGAVIHNVLALIANENRYHPVLELLNAEPWDGADRLPEIYRILGLDDDFHKTLVYRWALQTIAVLQNNSATPIATQGALVLQGAQGLGKTQFFRHIAIHDSFFKGGATIDMNNKDSQMSAVKVWMCELGEIDSVTKKEQNPLKAFILEQTDRFREPYAKNESIRPRRTSFCGTVNPEFYLRDVTGNRRYWTVPVKKVDVNQIFNLPPEWYTQFWRQMQAELRRDPKSYLLTEQEQDTLNGRNMSFETQLFGEDEFMTIFDPQASFDCWQWKTAADIADTLNSKYHGLHIRSESIGGKLIPRIEKRTGKAFGRKTVKGRRLIHCPPLMVTHEYIPPL